MVQKRTPTLAQVRKLAIEKLGEGATCEIKSRQIGRSGRLEWWATAYAVDVELPDVLIETYDKSQALRMLAAALEAV